MIDRTQIPAYTNDFDLSIKNLDQFTLSNGIPVYKLSGGSQKIINVEWVFERGRIHERKKAVAKASFKMMRDGSKMGSAQEIDHVFDFYGAVVRLNTGMEYSSLSIFCLERYIEKVWPFFFDMIVNPSYPENELENYKRVQSQKTREILSKNDILAYRLLTEKIFGETHPYGYNTEPEDIESLKRKDILDYFKNNCQPENTFVILSGNFSPKTEKFILKNFEAFSTSPKEDYIDFPDPSNIIGSFKLPTENKHQTSIKIGCLWVPSHHKDYLGLRFLNTVLGGYFGSRLMKNIREDKGYTYGIYSMVDAFIKESYFYISADVGKDFIEPTINEVYKELDLLKKIPISQEEIEMVKNYLLGQSLHLIDGPFATAKLIKTLTVKKRSLEDYNNSIEAIKNISSAEIQGLAQQYFNKEKMTTVLVGNI